MQEELHIAFLKKFTFQDITSLKKIFALSKRIRAVKGGTSAAKTIGIVTWSIDYSQKKYTKEKVLTIVSESFPHLSLGAIRDFKSIMMDRKYWDENRWNATNHFYTFETGNIIEFMSMDSYGKAHGPRRDVLFLNECNNLSWEIVDQLIIRTREIVWMDWNPTEEFWFHTQLLPFRDDIDFITLTYKDNEALDEVTILEIESHKHNTNWWNVYGLGLDGTVEGRIYKGWKIIDEVPHEARLIGYGLDYGYTTDPTAIVAIYYYNGGYIFHEIAYTKGLSNKKISDILLGLDAAPVVADSAEPKSNDELREYGITIIGATKGSGSVNQGIQFVQDQPCSVTKSSVNVIKEYRNYMFIKDKKTGLIINEPQDVMNHAMDGIRYGMQLKSIPKKADDYVQPAYEKPGISRTATSPQMSYKQGGVSDPFKNRIRLGGTESAEQAPWQKPGM